MLNQQKSKLFIMIIGLLVAFTTINFAQIEQLSTKLTATQNEKGVDLEWTAPTSDAIVSFNIYRAAISSSVSEVDPSNLNFVKVGSTDKLSYSDKVEGVEKGTHSYYYYVATVDLDGNEGIKSNFVNVGVINATDVQSSL